MFAKFWTASTISSLGSAATTVALPVLVVRQLGASNFEIGLVNAAQLVPYLVLGLFAGVFIDRWRRRPLLIRASIGRAVLLGCVPAFWAAGWLSLPLLVALLIGFGALNVFAIAGAQSFLPAVVPRRHLFRANARLDQSDAVAQTLGPAAGGALVAALGAPLILLIDAISYLVDAVLIGRVTVDEPEPAAPRRAGIAAAIAEGMQWIYRHPTLGPMTVSSHVWFVGNNAMLTVMAPFALRQLGLSSLTFGLLFALLGVTTLIGALLSPRIGDLLGVGPSIVVCRAGYPVALIMLAVVAGHGVTPTTAAVVVFVALGLWGLISGIENPNEMGYRQTVTPPEFLGRVNSTARSANRTCAVLGALAGGAVSGAFGYRTAFLLSASALVAAFVIAVVTPLRSARIET
jgi:MFS family permease